MKRGSTTMDIRESKPSWFPRPATHREEEAEFHLHVHGKSYNFRKKCLVARSGKLAKLLEENYQNEHQVSYSLKDMPGDSKTFEIAMKFCYGIEPNLLSDNVIPIICLAYYLDMTETHSPNNLLDKSFNFLQHKVLPLWNESVQAFRSTQEVSKQAVNLRLMDACLDSLVKKARVDPRLLGQPFLHVPNNIGDTDTEVKVRLMPNARRRLSVNNCCNKSEDLTMLNLQLYELVMSLMIQAGVAAEYVATSLYQYTQKWANINDHEDNQDEDVMVYKREVIETVEKLLLHKKGILPCKLLFEMLQTAIALQASATCRHGWEIRIGKQLTEATVEDLLLIPSQGYAIELQYDVESVIRILKTFYANYNPSDHPSGLIIVMELMGKFLAKVATDADLKKDMFIAIAEMTITTSVGIKRNMDKIYRAIDIYFEKHIYLTESEREEVCQVLDCHKLSPEACTHAAQNERLPMRVMMQALFMGQLHLRDAIISSRNSSADFYNQLHKEEMTVMGDGNVEEVRTEMDKMDTRVIGLEKECSEMKKQLLVKGGISGRKGSMWKSLKRKFGCISGMQDCNCHVKKKVHPRN